MRPASPKLGLPNEIFPAVPVEPTAPVAVPVAAVQVVQAAPVDAGSATLAEPGFLIRPDSAKLGFLMEVVPVEPTVPAAVPVT